MQGVWSNDIDGVYVVAVDEFAVIVGDDLDIEHPGGSPGSILVDIADRHQFCPWMGAVYRQVTRIGSATRAHNTYSNFTISQDLTLQKKLTIPYDSLFDHQSGSPRTRFATMLSCTSLVPPAMDAALDPSQVRVNSSSSALKLSPSQPNACVPRALSSSSC